MVEKNTAYDYGIQALLGIGNTGRFFERFGLKRVPFSYPNVTTEYIDFDTGELVNLTTPSMDAQSAALRKFLDIIDPWTRYLQPGN